MRELAYYLVDVFTDVPFGGNQLAVFTEPGNLTTEQMQTIARELRLSETVFVYPPHDAANHAQLRIFTPDMELPFAGHPTVGTGYVLHQTGFLPDVGKYRFEEGVGAIAIEVTQAETGAILVSMTQPVPQFGVIRDDRAAIAEMLTLPVEALLDLPIQAVSSGVPFTFIPIKTLADMRRIHVRSDMWEHYLKDSGAPHIFTFSPETEHATSTVHSRMFAPLMGIPEDPATGAASGPLGAYLLRYGLVKPEDASAIISEQGIEMGRPSFIRIGITGTPDQITGASIGGATQPIGKGVLYWRD